MKTTRIMCMKGRLVGTFMSLPELKLHALYAQRDCQRPVAGVWSDSSLYPVYVGGNYNSNPNYGLWYFNADNAASNSNANLGSRILFEYNSSSTNCAGSPLALAKNIAVLGGV